MYGLVNRAVEGLIRKEFGDSTWTAVMQRAGLAIDHFGRMEYYDDEVTYRLVGAASEELGAPADDLLVAFGRYWVLYVAEEGYGAMLSMAGASLRGFLEHLDTLHAQVGLGHPQMRPPAFRVERTGDDVLLHYHSTRAGLGAMVMGLLEGLAARFGERIEVTWLRADATVDHDRFRIHWT